ncbi:YbaB/EbfC family DNA-binding protein [Pseudonocardia sp. ICBG1122]|nr:YbaB/EbfC family DNA-binding protein [Pseudonocardia pini]
MSDATDHEGYYARRLDEAFGQLERERTRVDEVSRVWKEEQTAIVSKDRSFTMTFDGRGDLADLSFHGTRYRSLAPTEFAHLIVATLQAGRLQALERTAAIVQEGGGMEGLDLVGLATGKVDPTEMIESLMGSMFAEMGVEDPTRGERRAR